MEQLSNKSLLSVKNLDFDEIKADLKNYLSSQELFKDYNFDGSGLSILLDVLAYNTHHMSFYSNMIANESFLDSCILRDSAVSLSKSLGYSPRSRRGAEVVVESINKKADNTIEVILKRKDGKKFFNYLPTVSANLEKAIEKGELTFKN